jgi:trypsin
VTPAKAAKVAIQRPMTADSNLRHPEILAAVFIAACSGETVSPRSSTAAPAVDIVAPPYGVPDRGFDPAVVAVDFGGTSPCAGVLLAPDVVLTARHCVMIVVGPLHCPGGVAQASPRTPGSLRILVGDDASIAIERARARDVLVPPDADLCAADVAALLLDRAIDDVKPLLVRPTGAARGDHVRTVGFTSGSGAHHSTKLLRDHLAVFDTTPTDLRIEETASDNGGGPALDESTEEVLGVLSTGDGDVSIYARADAFASLVASALAESPSASSARGAARPKKGPADMGANCVEGADCAAGVCVADGPRQYCSRTCSSDDRCPARFRCERSDHGQDICVAT